MTEEEIRLRTKFYLTPKSVTLEQLRIMEEKYPAYPGLTLEQAIESHKKLVETHGHLMPNKNI